MYLKWQPARLKKKFDLKDMFNVKSLSTIQKKMMFWFFQQRHTSELTTKQQIVY